MDVDMGPPPFVVGQACASAGWPATVRIAPDTPEPSIHNMPSLLSDDLEWVVWHAPTDTRGNFFGNPAPRPCSRLRRCPCSADAGDVGVHRGYPYPGATEVEQISVKGMRDMLLDPGVPSEVRDSIWSRLLRTSREKKDLWDVVTIWMMAPGLRRICWNCRRFGFVADLAELEAEAVSAFLATARSADPDRPELGAWLWSATYRHVRDAVSRPRLTFTALSRAMPALPGRPPLQGRRGRRRHGPVGPCLA
ncbi:hypothetical protein FrEUN1fDRAFT_7839 [Parafrankia sp. EUN1f]|nr:hypothetical protein FrEUN1fDRAFT_7839 [Parafrankia sp. EUN1f]